MIMVSIRLIDDRAGLFRPGWIANAISVRVGGRELQEGRDERLAIVLLLAERARSERWSLDARSEDGLPIPLGKVKD